MSIIRNGLLSADLDVPVVLPTLNLDFANSQSLDKRITFSRGSIGTRVNRNGLIETIPANQPRFDFDPISGECRGLLIEESRSNLVTDTATNFNYSISQVGPTQLDIAPDGTSVLCKHDLTGANQPFLNCRANTTLSSGNTYTMSMWLKGTTSFSASFAFIGETTNEIYANTANITTTWQRFTLTFTLVATQTASRLQVFFARQGEAKIISIWAAQLEQGAFATSYIPRSSGAQATRSADLVEMTGTNFSSWYNQSEGTIVAKSFIPTNSIYSGTFRSLVQFIKSSTYNSDSIFLLINDIVSSAIESKSSSLRFISFNQSTYSSGNISAISYKEKYYTLSTKGLFPTSSLSGALPSGIDKMIIGNVGDNNPLGCANGTISRIAYYPKALSPAELQYLTQ